jgi:endonuclease YncB( thermonuclease family)
MERTDTVSVSIIKGSLSFEVTAPIVSVLDGDTIEVLHNTHPERN